MAQQMHSEEEQRGYGGMRDYETSYTPTMGETASSYNQRYTPMPAQKAVAPFAIVEKSAPSAGQRLALAIVSMVVLIGSLFAITDGWPDGFTMIAARLVGVIVVCMTTVVINFIFGMKR